MIDLPAALWVAVLACEVGALVAAVRPPLTHRSRPLVLLLAYAIGSDLAVSAGRAILLDSAPRPFAGLARAWYHWETALVIGWPVGLALAASALFGRRRIGPVVALAAGFTAVVCMVVLHPVRSSDVVLLLLPAELLCVASAAYSVWRGWRETWGRAHHALLVLLAIELVVMILGPWSHDLHRDWPVLARVPYVAGFGTAAAVLAWGRGRRES